MFDKVSNLKGVLKVMILKFSVGLIVLQGLIAQFLVIANAEPYNDDSQWSKEEKTLRGYCLLVMLEFVILQIPYLIGFLPKIDPSSAKEGQEAAAPKAPTLCHFILQVLYIHDVFGYIRYTGEINQNLASNMK